MLQAQKDQPVMAGPASARVVPIQRSDIGLGRRLTGQVLSPTRLWAQHAKTLATILGIGLVLPLIYGFALFEELSVLELPANIQNHIGVNVLCNLASILCALYMRGRISRRLGYAILVPIAIHSVLLFSIIGGRLYYSRSVLLAAMLVSMTLSLIIVICMEQWRSRRIGIVAHAVSDELLSWIGDKGELIRTPLVNSRDFDVILVNFSQDLSPDWARFTSRAMLSGCEVRHLAGYVEELRGRVSTDHFEPDHLAANPEVNLYPVLKRLMDILLVMIMLPVALPLLGLAAILVVISMGRPVLFVQERCGLGGTPFRMYKLRTMRVRRPGEVAIATTIGDNRITPIGRFLRRYRIDELPQLWNVLKGDMSFIGPRPEQPALSARYAQQIPAFEYRHIVRPGITGWAQVRFGYAANAAETRDKLSYDLYYTKYLSLSLDMWILANTVSAVIRGNSVR